jgi:hypothetical protein
MGVKLRPSGKPKLSKTDPRVITATTLRREGLTYEAIGAEMGVHKTAAWGYVQRGMEP